MSQNELNYWNLVKLEGRIKNHNPTTVALNEFVVDV